jgi:hypothetical protein
MSLAEMKEHIQQKLVHLNEEQLKQVDQFIALINKEEIAQNDFLKHAFAIIDTNPDLLHRLAQ